jgi:hypothetical protein
MSRILEKSDEGKVIVFDSKSKYKVECCLNESVD